VVPLLTHRIDTLRRSWDGTGGLRVKRFLADALNRVGLTRGSNLLLVVVILGLVGSLVASAYVGLMRLLTAIGQPALHHPWTILLMTTGAGAAISFFLHLLGDPGSTEALVDGVHLTGGPSDMKRVPPLIPVSLLTISFGGGIGPEAPLVQLTGTLGGFFGRHTMRGLADRRTVTIAGMGIGFTVLFGAPLGGALFALEILHRKGMQYYEAILPALVSSAIGYLAYTGLTHLGIGPVWHFPPVGYLRWGEGGWAILLSLLGAALAVGFAYLLHTVRRLFRRVPYWTRPIIGGMLIGLIGWAQPLAIYFGEPQLNTMVAAHLAVLTLLVLIVLKALATTITIGAEWRGGFIIPLFFLGAATGQLVAHYLNINPGLAMIVLMTSINVGVTKTPVSTPVLVTSMTGTSAIPALLIASVISMLVTARWTVIETQRERAPVLARIDPLHAGARTEALADGLTAEDGADDLDVAGRPHAGEVPADAAQTSTTHSNPQPGAR
jgi:H+/Cl- antiporter ClcA